MVYLQWQLENVQHVETSVASYRKQFELQTTSKILAMSVQGLRQPATRVSCISELSNAALGAMA